MPYSITTKDGITINNIPDDVSPDSPELKERVAKIRAEGVKQESAKPAKETTARGVIGAVARPALPVAGGAALGALLASPTGVGVPVGAAAGAGAAVLAPAIGDPAVRLFNQAFGTNITEPSQALANLMDRLGIARPESEAEKTIEAVTNAATSVAAPYSIGKTLATSSSPVISAVGKTLADKPVLQSLGASSGVLASEGVRQAGGGEGAQLAAGLAAGVLTPLAAERAMAANIAKSTAGTAIGKPRQAPITAQTATTQPTRQADKVTQTTQPAAAISAAPEASTVQAVTAESFEDVGKLIRKASGSGVGSEAARTKLADLSRINPDAKLAAERLGLDLPFDVFSDSPQIRAAAGLTRSVAGSEAEAAWRNTISKSIDQIDELLKNFDVNFVEGSVAPGVVSEKVKNSLIKSRVKLNNQATEIYKQVDEIVPKTSIVSLPKLQQTLDSVKEEVGERGMSSAERNLANLIKEGKITYGRLKREKSLIGKAIDKMDSPYSNMAEADLKRLYAALAEDQLTNVGNIGGDKLRQRLRAANLLYAKERALGQRIVKAFGKDFEGGIADKMRLAITGAAKGDAGDLNRLLKTVPEDLRKETLATALASVTRSNRGLEKGGFGFSEFATIYPKLRANPPVYKTIVETLGKESEQTLRDLFEISKRITDARAQVLTTGKANQALVNSLKTEGLIGKVMQSTTSQRIATGVASTVPGGGFIAPDIVQAMAKGNKDAVKAAGKLFTSDDFQKLAIESATKTEPSVSTLRKVASSKAFVDFAKATKMDMSMSARMLWLQSALQAERIATQESEE